MNLSELILRLSRKQMIKLAMAAALSTVALIWLFSGNDESVTTAEPLPSTPTGVSSTPESTSVDRAGTSAPRTDSTVSALNLLPSPPGALDSQLIGVEGLDCLIEPHLTVEVATTATGIVKEIHVDRGSLVKTGQVLAHLESEVEKANVAHARARVDFASKKLKRMKELFKEQMVSSQQLDEAQAEHDLAQAELQKADELLKQRTIESPLSGVVVERFVSPGELVENKKIVKLAQVNPLNVEIIAPVSMLGGFKTGAKVHVFPEGPIAGPLEASVMLVDRVVDAPSGTFRVRLNLPNRKFEIPAGVRCRARLAQGAVSILDGSPATRAEKGSPAAASNLTSKSNRKPKRKMINASRQSLPVPSTPSLATTDVLPEPSTHTKSSEETGKLGPNLETVETTAPDSQPPSTTAVQ